MGPMVNHTTAGPHEQQLVVTDNNTGRPFLVDTGAQVSVVPSSRQDRCSGPSDQHIQAENRTYIATYGTHNVLLYLGNHRYSAHRVIADAIRPFLGEDFLRQHYLFVDVRGQRLIESDTYLSASCDVTVTSVSQLAPI